MTSVVPVHGHFSNSDAAGKMNNLSGGGCEASEEGGSVWMGEGIELLRGLEKMGELAGILPLPSPALSAPRSR